MPSPLCRWYQGRKQTHPTCDQTRWSSTAAPSLPQPQRSLRRSEHRSAPAPLRRHRQAARWKRKHPKRGPRNRIPFGAPRHPGQKPVHSARPQPQRLGAGIQLPKSPLSPAQPAPNTDSPPLRRLSPSPDFQCNPPMGHSGSTSPWGRDRRFCLAQSPARRRTC